MGRDSIYIPLTYRKVVVSLGFRSRIFLDITTQQNQVNKHQNIFKPNKYFELETDF